MEGLIYMPDGCVAPRMLGDLPYAGHTASAVASGLGDLSYFNRAFRRR
jgi:hypothetical protein